MTKTGFNAVDGIVESEMAKLRKVVTQPGTPLGKEEDAAFLLELGLIEPVEASSKIYRETPIGRGVFIDYLLRHPPATQITNRFPNPPKDLKINWQYLV